MARMIRSSSRIVADQRPVRQDGPMRPMLASAGTVIPGGPQWAHEIKWDGMRVLADVADGRLRLWSRNENDVTSTFPELSTLAGSGMPDDMLLDGEVVALDAGRPSFSALSERMHISNVRKARRLAVARPVTFMVFDLLRLERVDLTSQSLAQRRAALEGIGLAGVNTQVPPTYADGGAPVSYTHLRAHETDSNLVCRLLLETKKN